MNIDGRTFLITGGASLIGSHLTRVLLNAGAKSVILLDNLCLGDQKAIASFPKSSVQFVRGDVLNLSQVVDSVRDADGVFAFAAFMTLPISKAPSEGVQVNVMGVLNVLEAARILGGKKVVLASSIAVYGNGVDGLVEEARPFASFGSSSAFATYAATKLVGEQVGRLYTQKYGIDFSIVRFSTAYGENQHTRGVNALYILESLQAVRSGIPPTILGSGEEAHDYIYATDAARGAMMAMERGKNGECYNIATGVSTSVNEIVDMVLKEYASPLEPKHLDDTRNARGTAHSRLNISNERARRELGWSPETTMREGITRLRKWLEGAPQ